jgi:hypothetical protein
LAEDGIVNDKVSSQEQKVSSRPALLALANWRVFVWSGSTPQQHDISNEAHELREAQDGFEARTTRRINQEIHEAHQDIAELRRQGLKGEEPKRLRLLIAVLENEKSAVEPAAPAFVPAAQLLFQYAAAGLLRRSLL